MTDDERPRVPRRVRSKESPELQEWKDQRERDGLPIHGPEYQREKGKWYRELTRNRRRELQAAYKERNREHVRTYNREYMRAQAQRRRAEEEKHARRAEQSRQYYAANKDKWVGYSRAYVARQRAEDPDGFRERRRANNAADYQRHREERLAAKRDAHRDNPDARRAAARDYYERHKDEVKAKSRDRYQANKERAKTAAAAWRRREKNRQQGGLPTERLHGTSSAERAENRASATAFFTTPRTPEQIARLKEECAVSTAMIAAWERDCQRARADVYLAGQPTIGHKFVDPTDKEVFRRIAREREQARRDAAQAAEDARLDEIARNVNDTLRHTPRLPNRRPAALGPHAGPATPGRGLGL